MTCPSSLNSEQRANALANIDRTSFDVVVIGGGVTGAGVALDAASRGLSVALFEANDFAHGTSSRSGKIFHGGLRYLEQLNFGLVREALVERDRMVAELCPHLVEPIPFLIPFTRHWERPYIGTGVALYDLLRLTGPRSVRGHRHFTRKSVLRQMPALRPDRVTGGVRFYDVRVDDARHTMTVARTAASRGATVLTRTPVVGMVRDGGRVRGVRIRDAESSREIDIRAQVVVNATGVWADRVQALAGEQTIDITPSKGIHLMVPGNRIESSTGLIARAADSLLITRKWFGHWLIGTTDTKWDLPPDNPVALQDDVDFLLREANRWLRRQLTYDDLVGVYAGLRPLVTGRGATTSALRRDHAVLPGPPGLITVVGGKYTTYRVMARDTVDAAAKMLDRPVEKSRTEHLPLLGADGYPALREQRSTLASDAGIAERWINHLLGRYGSDVLGLLDLITDNPDLGKPLDGAPGYLAAEVVYALAHEGARGVDDVLMRRTRAVIETPDHGATAAGHVADLAGKFLGWDDERQAIEVEKYRDLVAEPWTDRLTP